MKKPQYKLLQVNPKYLKTLTVSQKEALRKMDERLVSKYQHALKSPSERNFEAVEAMTGLTADWSDADYGEAPLKYNQ